MASVKTLADEASRLRHEYSSMANAVYRVLDNHHINNDARSRTFGEIMAEFRRRQAAKRAKKKVIPAGEPATTVHTRTEQNGPDNRTLFEARLHELRQPPDSYDTDTADEIAHKLGLPPRGET